MRRIFIRLWAGLVGAHAGGIMLAALLGAWTSPNMLAYAVQSRENGGIHVMDLTHQLNHPLLRGASTSSLAWSPDGTQLAFSMVRDGYWTLHVADANGHNLRALTAPNADAIAPAWSPDGIHLAYTAKDLESTRLMIMNVHNQETHRVGDENTLLDNVSWSPDGRMLAAVASKKRIVLMTNTGADMQTIYASRTQVITEPPAWSPDGQTLMFVAAAPPDYRSRVFYILLAGGRANRLLPINDMQMTPSWHPDGAHILFASYAEQRGWQIVLFNRENGAMQSLSAGPGGDALYPVWRP